EHYVKSIILDNLKLLLILEFVVNFYTFNFLVEFFLVPIFVFIGGMQAISETKAEYVPIKKFISFISSAFGMFLLFYAFHKVVTDYKSLATLENIRSFILQPSLTLLLIPYLYFVGLLMVYQALFKRFDIFLKRREKNLARYAKWKVFILCHINLRKLNRFVKANTMKFMRVDSREDVKSIVKTFSG
ncbi:MAG TPA: hypothetical protein PKD09_16180, partial [Aggregatilinea sp.]